MNAWFKTEKIDAAIFLREIWCTKERCSPIIRPPNTAAYLASLEKIAQLPTKRIFPAHHSLDIVSEIVIRMCDELHMLNSKGLFCHGSEMFDFGDWALRI